MLLVVRIACHYGLSTQKAKIICNLSLLVYYRYRLNEKVLTMSRTVLQIRITEDDKARARKVAEYRGQDLSAWMREAIRRSYGQLPAEAKIGGPV